MKKILCIILIALSVLLPACTTVSVETTDSTEGKSHMLGPLTFTMESLQDVKAFVALGKETDDTITAYIKENDSPWGLKRAEHLHSAAQRMDTNYLWMEHTFVSFGRMEQCFDTGSLIWWYLGDQKLHGSILDYKGKNGWNSDLQEVNAILEEKREKNQILRILNVEDYELTFLTPELHEGEDSWISWLGYLTNKKQA